MSIKRACKAANVLDDRLDTQLAWSGEPAVGQPDVHYFPVFPPARAPAGVLVTSGRSSGTLVSSGRREVQLRPVKWCPTAGVGQIVANSGRSTAVRAVPAVDIRAPAGV